MRLQRLSRERVFLPVYAVYIDELALYKAFLAVCKVGVYDQFLAFKRQFSDELVFYWAGDAN